MHASKAVAALPVPMHTVIAEGTRPPSRSVARSYSASSPAASRCTTACRMSNTLSSGPNLLKAPMSAVKVFVFGCTPSAHILKPGNQKNQTQVPVGEIFFLLHVHIPHLLTTAAVLFPCVASVKGMQRVCLSFVRMPIKLPPSAQLHAHRAARLSICRPSIYPIPWPSS
jgi:hypothetical protein